MKGIRFWWQRFWAWKVPPFEDAELLARLWALKKHAEALRPTLSFKETK